MAIADGEELRSSKYRITRRAWQYSISFRTRQGRAPSGWLSVTSALSFPVLRLNLMLPLRFQGLGTSGWLGLARWGFPTQFRQLTNATENSFRLQVEIGVADFAARTANMIIPY